jgi:hypothetical protein
MNDSARPLNAVSQAKLVKLQNCFRKISVSQAHSQFSSKEKWQKMWRRKKPKFFSNDGGDNYITAKHVGGQMLKQLIYCCYTRVQQIHHKG